MTELLEILDKPILNINPAFVHGIRSAFQQNLTSHAPMPAEFGTKRSGVFLPLSKAQDFLNTIYATDNPKAAILGWDAYIDDDDQFINIVNVLGPITRNAGGCSIGSKQHRDQILFAVSRSNCIGHIFNIDTPGGSSFSKNDYAQAIDAIHAAGQKAYAIVDGNAYSAGQALAALCDEVYYTHENDGFGCIGTMAAFYTQKNGDKNEYTNETYRELYDPESFGKNAEVRALANDDDESLIIEELRKDGAEFRALVKAHRPNVTEEMLHGKTYTAKEVEGILNDGKRTLAEQIQIIADNYKKQSAPAPNPTTEPISAHKTNTSINHQNSPTMNFQNIEKLLDLTKEGLHVSEDNTSSLDILSLQTIDNALASVAQKDADLATANASLISLNGEIAKLKEQIATLQQEKQAAVELNSALTAERDTLATEKADLTQQLETAKQQASSSDTSVTDLNAKVTDLTQQLANRDAQIAELQQRGTQPPTPAPQEPANEPQSQSTSAFQGYDPSLSIEENRKRIQALTPAQYQL